MGLKFQVEPIQIFQSLTFSHQIVGRTNLEGLELGPPDNLLMYIRKSYIPRPGHSTPAFC